MTEIILPPTPELKRGRKSKRRTVTVSAVSHTTLTAPVSADTKRGRKRKYHKDRPATAKERAAASYARRKAEKETDK